MSALDFATPAKGPRGFSSYFSFPAATGVLNVGGTLYRGVFIRLNGNPTLETTFTVRNTGSTNVQIAAVPFTINDVPVDPYGTTDYSAFTASGGPTGQTPVLVPGASTLVSCDPPELPGVNALFLTYVTTSDPSLASGPAEIKFTTSVEHAVLSLPESFPETIA